jgi:hypothetical protein
MGWMEDAACRGFPELPWTGDSPEVHTVYRQAMRAVCWSCPVRAACEAYADQQGITGGFWAGRFYPRFEPPAVWRPSTDRAAPTDPDHRSHRLATDDGENGECA